MGYYSETALVLSGKGVDFLHTKLSEASDEVRKKVHDCLKYTTHLYVDPNSKAEVWHWNSIKWYDDWSDYLDIVFLAKLMDELDSQDYHFIRIGEDYDDVEIKGNFWNNPFDVAVERSITLQATA